MVKKFNLHALPRLPLDQNLKPESFVKSVSVRLEGS